MREKERWWHERERTQWCATCWSREKIENV